MGIWREYCAAGITHALTPNHEFLVGDGITLADICFVAELCLFFNETRNVKEIEKHGLAPILHARVNMEYPRIFAHLARLHTHPAFALEVEPYLKKFDTVGQGVSPR
jgi:elongation factor 1-gamma